MSSSVINKCFVALPCVNYANDILLLIKNINDIFLLCLLNNDNFSVDTEGLILDK